MTLIMKSITLSSCSLSLPSRRLFDPLFAEVMKKAQSGPGPDLLDIIIIKIYFTPLQTTTAQVVLEKLSFLKVICFVVQNRSITAIGILNISY